MEFWEDLIGGMTKEASSLDEHLADQSSAESVRHLTDRIREASGLPLPVEAGTRVSFRGNLGAVLSYSGTLREADEGTVVTVRVPSSRNRAADRLGSTNLTALDRLVFVKWDSGDFLPVQAEHLRAAKAQETSSFLMRVASMLDLTDFMKVSGEDLVHKATKDLWAMRKDGDEFVIERLFDETGKPLKV